MKASEFWDWFVINKKSLEDFLRSDLNDYSPYEELSDQLGEFSNKVIAELTIDKQNNFVLILSCDGNREGIPFVEELASVAPPINTWIIKKYRQRSSFMNFPVDGLAFNENDILVKYEKVAAEEKYDIELFVKGYNKEDRRYDLALAVYLDHNIGEFNAMTKIRYADVKKLGIFKSKKEMVTLSDFGQIIDN